MIIYVKEFGNKNDIAYLLNIGNLYISCIFNLIWNIIGSIIFWGYISEKANCSVVVFNYLYTTFIIRLLIITILIINTKNNKEKIISKLLFKVIFLTHFIL